MKTNIWVFFIMNIAFACCFTAHAQKRDFLKIPGNIVTEGTKICSCQLVEIQSPGYLKQRIGIFAEKDQTGKLMRNYRVMNAMIRKEKNYLEKVFVSNVRTLDRYRSNTDCMTLYFKIKEENANFRMYNILNVNILLDLAHQ